MSIKKDRLTSNQQLAVNMAAQFISFAVSVGISFFLTPYIIDTIGVEANGFVGLANNFTNYASIITIALNSMAGRFITICIHRDDYENASRYFSSVFMANVVTAAALTVPAVYILINMSNLFDVPDEMVADVTALWALVFANFLIGNITSVFSVATFAKNRLDLQSVTGIFSGVIRALFIVVAYFLFDAKVWFLGAATLVCAVFGIIANIYFLKRLTPQINIRRKYFSLSLIKELVASGVWNSVSKVSNVLSEGLDLLIANVLVGSTAMGIVSVAKQMPMHILSFMGTLSSVFAPQLTISYAKNDFEDIKKQLISAIKIIGFISCIPLTIMYAYGDIFFTLWAPKQDAKLLQLIAVVASLEFPLVLPLEPLWAVFTTTNKVKQSSLYLVVNSILTVVIELIMLQFAQTEFQKIMIIVGVSTVFSIIRALTFLPIYGAKCLGFKKTTFYKPAFQNLLAVIVLTVIALLIRTVITVDSWFMLIVVSAITAVLSFVINYFALLNKEEREMLKVKLLKRRIKE